MMLRRVVLINSAGVELGVLSVSERDTIVHYGGGYFAPDIDGKMFAHGDEIIPIWRQPGSILTTYKLDIDFRATRRAGAEVGDPPQMTDAIPGTQRPTSFPGEWLAASKAKPLDDGWIEQLLAHCEEGPIGEAAARDLLREVLRLRQRRAATTITFERHAMDGSDETMGFRWVIGDKLAVWCGEISRQRFDELSPEQRMACGDTDMGWFIAIYDETMARGEQSEIVAKALDQKTGVRLAALIATALAGG